MFANLRFCFEAVPKHAALLQGPTLCPRGPSALTSPTGAQRPPWVSPGRPVDFHTPTLCLHDSLQTLWYCEHSKSLTPFWASFKCLPKKFLSLRRNLNHVVDSQDTQLRPTTVTGVGPAGLLPPWPVCGTVPGTWSSPAEERGKPF